MIKAFGYVMFAIAFALCTFLTIGITAIIVRAIFGKPSDWYRKDELGENDPGVDVDLDPINADGTPSPAIVAKLNTPASVCPHCGRALDAFGICPDL